MQKNIECCKLESEFYVARLSHQHHHPALGKVLADDAVEVDAAGQVFSSNREAARRAGLEKTLEEGSDPAAAEVEEVDADVLGLTDGEGEGRLWRWMAS